MTRLRKSLVALAVLCIAGAAAAANLGDGRIQRFDTEAELTTQTSANLPPGVVNGFAVDTGSLWLWDGSTWIKISSSIGTGALYRTYETSTGGDTRRVSDTVSVHVCNSTTAYVLYLPTLSLGREIRIVNAGVGVVTLRPISSPGINSTIKGSLTETLAQWESLILISDGANWL